MFMYHMGLLNSAIQYLHLSAPLWFFYKTTWFILKLHIYSKISAESHVDIPKVYFLVKLWLKYEDVPIIANLEYEVGHIF